MDIYEITEKFNALSTNYNIEKLQEIRKEWVDKNNKTFKDYEAENMK